MPPDRLSATGELPRGVPPRKKLKRVEEHLGWRFLTCSCYRRLQLFADEWVKDLFVEILAAARERHGFRLIAWVVMPEHVHLIIIPTAGLGTGSAVPLILIGIKKTLSDRVLREWRRGTGFVALDDARAGGDKTTGIAQSSEARGTMCPVPLESIRTKDGKERFWQPGGGFDRNIRDGKELAREIEYIHQNPVKRGLVEKPTDWKWSSARWYAGIRAGTLSIDSLDFH